MTLTSKALPAFTALSMIVALFMAVAHAQSSSPSVANVANDYFPLAVGNEWTYSSLSMSVGAGGGKNVKWTVTQKETINGNVVFHLWETPSESDESYDLASSTGGILEAGSTRYLLRTPLKVGQKWQSQSQSLRAKGALDNFEVTAVGTPCSVGKLHFANCAMIREDDGANNLTLLTTYALGVGPVKYVYSKPLHADKIDTVLTISHWKVH